MVEAKDGRSIDIKSISARQKTKIPEIIPQIASGVVFEKASRNPGSEVVCRFPPEKKETHRRRSRVKILPF